MTSLFSWSEAGHGSVSFDVVAGGEVCLQVHAMDPRFGVVSLIVPAEQLRGIEEALRRHRIATTKKEEPHG